LNQFRSIREDCHARYQTVARSRHRLDRGRSGVVSVRHDFNDSGAGGPIANGNAVNVGFNVPGTPYLHGYVEANLGANSALAGASSGPTWKGMVWLTIPVVRIR
jgi:hypothetical protein